MSAQEYYGGGDNKASVCNTMFLPLREVVVGHTQKNLLLTYRLTNLAVFSSGCTSPKPYWSG